MKIRVTDRQTGRPIKVERIDMHLGRIHLINMAPAHLFEVEALLSVRAGKSGLLGKNWEPVSIEFVEEE